MSLTKVKVSLIGALVAAGIAVPTWQQTRLQRVQSENAQLRAKETELRTQETELAALRGEVERLRKVEDGHAELEQLRQWKAQTQSELLRLRGMAGVARRANVEAEQLRAQLARQASEPGTNLITGAMLDGMKQAMERQVEGRLSRLTASLHLTPEQAQGVHEILMRHAQAMSAGVQQVYTGKYNKEELTRLGKEAGDPDTQIKALLTPGQQAAYPNYQQEEAAYNARRAANSELLRLQSTLNLTSEQEDRAFAALYQVSFDQLTGKAKPTTTGQVEAMQWALDQKTKALEPVLTPTQLADYREQQAAQAKLMKDIYSKMERSRDAK